MRYSRVSSALRPTAVRGWSDSFWYCTIEPLRISRASPASVLNSGMSGVRSVPVPLIERRIVATLSCEMLRANVRNSWNSE